ncbi:hypothetical protein T484DRAFT_1852284 [Baffinella frigidus]|nr:hypothetical protein T484DRAFT_1852284 [Cryptophyta sp. CCMP2293]
MPKGYIKRCANSLAMMLGMKQGPCSLIVLLLSEFNVNANCKDSSGVTLLTKAFQTGNVCNIQTLLVGTGTNFAVIDAFNWYDMTVDKNRDLKSNILSAVAMPTGRHFNKTTGKYSDRTTFVVGALLDRGATLYNNYQVDRADNGWSARCYVAHYGNTETMKLLLQTTPACNRKQYPAHSHTSNNHVDHMNKQYSIAEDMMFIVSMTPMLFITQNVTTTADGVTCQPCQWNCNALNCNMPMIKMFIDNGANPHICGHKRHFFSEDATDAGSPEVHLCYAHSA